MDITCEEADLSWTKSFTSVLIDEDKKVALCDSPHGEVAFTVGEEDEYTRRSLLKKRVLDMNIFQLCSEFGSFPQQSIESDGFGKYHRGRESVHRRRLSNGTWVRDDLYLQGIDDDMIYEEDDEWD
ncbi:F-box domain-containing protein [Raphanus sativus]|nr:F-box domain-containing protein [Raphanus sativus]